MGLLDRFRKKKDQRSVDAKAAKPGLDKPPPKKDFVNKAVDAMRKRKKMQEDLLNQ